MWVRGGQLVLYSCADSAGGGVGRDTTKRAGTDGRRLAGVSCWLNGERRSQLRRSACAEKGRQVPKRSRPESNLGGGGEAGQRGSYAAQEPGSRGEREESGDKRKAASAGIWVCRGRRFVPGQLVLARDQEGKEAYVACDGDLLGRRRSRIERSAEYKGSTGPPAHAALVKREGRCSQSPQRLSQFAI